MLAGLNEQTNDGMERWTKERSTEGTDGWMNEWVSQRVGGRTDGWMTFAMTNSTLYLDWDIQCIL